MNLLLGSLTIGLILSLLGLGVYISFKIFSFADMTADGSLTLGGAVVAILLVSGVSPLIATLAATGAGLLAGLVTGLLHTRCRIHPLLSGILTMTALYSVNLRVMGKSNISLMSTTTLADSAEQLGTPFFGTGGNVLLLGWQVAPRDLSVLLATLLLVLLASLLLYLFFRTNLGTVMRATGDNPQMVRAQGTDTGLMITLGLGISNGLIALSGALLTQYQGFSDVQMGIGMLVWGLASVIIGESLVRGGRLGLAICGVLIGSLLFRLLVAIALRFGLNPNDLKLITALCVFGALVLPGWLGSCTARMKGGSHA
jgi:putative tryptophan/tyrosine transport system permease protein